MKFCVNCNNMYYIGINQTNQNNLVHYCRFCSHVDDTIGKEGVCVLNNQYKKGEQKFNHIINEYTKLDPTLPRVYNIRCPNETCKTHETPDTPAEVIYLRYDDDNMKYLYICNECDNVWKTDDMHH